MKIIPVIDLLDGVVVHAKKGERQHYQPIKSLLTKSNQALDIIAAFLDLYPFEQLYIADLNAIQKKEVVYNTNYKIIESITEHFPQLKLWIDAGISSNAELDVWSKPPFNLVFGSENFSNLASFLALSNQQNLQFTLSLDFMPEGFKGPVELLENSYWPKDVIVMSLSKVGANEGTNTALLNEILTKAQSFNVYAAGGVRNIEDLISLMKMGVHGALIATALHQKQITSAHLHTFG